MDLTAAIKKMRKERGERGQALVEFALVLILFLMVFSATLDFGRLIYTKHMLDKATREAARAGAIELNNVDAITTAINVCDNVLSDFQDYSKLMVNVNIVKLQGVDALRVTASYPFQPFFAQGRLAVIPPITLNSTSVMRKEG